MKGLLFERLVVECGLSGLFARNSMARALKRAGVVPDLMTQEDLARALPEIRKALAPFLDKDLDARMARIQRLAAER